MPHQAGAPRLAGELAQSDADFDAVGFEQALAQRGVVSAFGKPGGGELRELVTLLGCEPEAENGELRMQACADAPVPLPYRVEALVEHGAEPGVQRIDHHDRRGVV